MKNLTDVVTLYLIKTKLEVRFLSKLNTVELQWLKHLRYHEIMFETGVVRANEVYHKKVRYFFFFYFL